VADWSDLTYDAGEYVYPDQCREQTDRMEAIASEVELARTFTISLYTILYNIQQELIAAREGEVDLVTNLQDNYFSSTDNDLLGSKIVNSTQGTIASDGITLFQANDMAANGGNTQLIEVTDFSDTVGVEGQRYLAGAGPATITVEDNDALTLDATGVGLNEVVVNSGGLTTTTLNNVSIGNLAVSSLVQTNASGIGLTEAVNADVTNTAAVIYSTAFI